MAIPEQALPRGAAEASGARSADQEAIELVAQIAAHDRQIGQFEAELRALPRELARLRGHPVLWLLLGRVGVDRPGGDWSALVGQQVVTVRQISWRLLFLVGVLMLSFGIAVGAVLASRW